MKKLFLFLLLATSALRAQETISLGSHGRLVLYLAGGWVIDESNLANRGTWTIVPKDEAVNASCAITVTYPEVDRFDTKARLKLRVEADGQGMAQGSVEGKAVAKELTLTSGYGFVCSFTDPELRGKPPQKGNFKVISIGRIRLAPDILLEISISADGFRDEPYQQLLGAIEGMEFRPGGR